MEERKISDSELREDVMTDQYRHEPEWLQNIEPPYEFDRPKTKREMIQQSPAEIHHHHHHHHYHEPQTHRQIIDHSSDKMWIFLGVIIAIIAIPAAFLIDIISKDSGGRTKAALKGFACIFIFSLIIEIAIDGFILEFIEEFIDGFIDGYNSYR
ncbi:MAG: hypothetical protein OXN88_12230 [Chloroflexota bacterium]|nr:hypothetical protein [Chloroflexota bacterium]